MPLSIQAREKLLQKLQWLGELKNASEGHTYERPLCTRYLAPSLFMCTTSSLIMYTTTWTTQDILALYVGHDLPPP